MTRLSTTEARQIARFLAAGGLAALVNIGSRWVFSHWLSYIPAIILGYALGLVTAFLLFRLTVFTAVKHHKTRDEIILFLVVNAGGLIQTLAVSVLLADYVFPAVNWTWHPPDIAHATGVISTAATSYLAHKIFTFRERPCA